MYINIKGLFTPPKKHTCYLDVQVSVKLFCIKCSFAILMQQYVMFLTKIYMHKNNTMLKFTPADIHQQIPNVYLKCIKSQD